MNHAWGLPSPPGGLAERVGWTLLHSLWQLAAVALTLTLVLALLRRRSPQARYAAGCLALAAIVALPIVTFVSLNPLKNVQRDAGDLVAANAMAPGESQPVGGSGGDSSAGASSARWARRIAAAWVVGVAGFSIWNFGGWVALRRMRHLCISPVPPDVLARFRTLALRLRVRPRVALLRSGLVASPVALGWLRPLVLVPASALSGLTPAQLDAILAHELAHIRRHDYFVNLLQTLAETLLFYHPAVWWVSRRMRIERELCCDDVAAELTDGGRVSYADALVAMEALRGPAPGFEVGPPVLAVGACDGGLVSRVRRLLGAPQTPGTWRAAVLAFMAVVVLPMTLAGFGTLGARSARTDVAVAVPENAFDNEERERRGGWLRLPRLRELEGFAMSIYTRVTPRDADPDDVEDDADLPPLARAVTHHVASAVRQGARMIRATGVPDGMRQVAATAYAELSRADQA